MKKLKLSVETGQVHYAKLAKRTAGLQSTALALIANYSAMETLVSER